MSQSIIYCRRFETAMHHTVFAFGIAASALAFPICLFQECLKAWGIPLPHQQIAGPLPAKDIPRRVTPWGNPTRNIFGWQRPCYLLVGEGYAPSFKALLEETDWES